MASSPLLFLCGCWKKKETKKRKTEPFYPGFTLHLESEKCMKSLF